MAKAQGLSKSSVHRIWQDHQIKPHLTRSFKLSRDPRFLEKLTDVVGVYLTPPQNAVVLCVDEKSQIQALDRTQPGLPLKRGRCGTFTHDYKRHGTTTLFAALHVVEGRVIGQCYPRHRHQEFLRFLRRLDGEFPTGKELHLILDNYGTHGPPAGPPMARQASPFCPALHPDEFELAEFGRAVVRRVESKNRAPGVFQSVDDWEQAIARFMNAWNANPSPFVWTASVERILKKIERCRLRLEDVKPGCTRPIRSKQAQPIV